jgi:hypothetical protein
VGIQHPAAKPLLVYTACPSRLADRTGEILTFVAGQGQAPLHPFQALPYKFFEGGLPGRERTLNWCCRLVDICDEFWLFGLSDGTKFELEYLIQQGRIQSFRDFSNLFDPEAASQQDDLRAILGASS